MPVKNPTAQTLRNQLEILLYLKGDVYRSTGEVFAFNKRAGIIIDRRTVQRWLCQMQDAQLVERKGGLFMRDNFSRSCVNAPRIDSLEWGWRWHRDSVMRLIAE